MNKQRVLLNKALVIGILILFIGMSVVSSTGKIIEDVSVCRNPVESVDNPKGLSSCDYIAYIGSYMFGGCWIYKGLLTGEPECICFEPGPSNISSATCTIDERIMAVEHGNGQLWEIEPENCEITPIGGGGIGLNGVTYDPIKDKLYGTSSYALYEIDPDTGEQTLIGSYNIGSIMISIACDQNGLLYGWDVSNGSGSYLYKIDTDTGEATVVGGMGMSLCYAQDGDFCKEDDILYLAAYTVTWHSYLCICDKETGELTILGEFPGNAAVTIFAFELPCNFPPYAPKIFEENGSLYVHTIDPDGNNVMYIINWGEGTTTETEYYPSGQKVEISHEWSPGVYEIRAKAMDIHGAESYWSDPYTIVIENLPPEAPTINGSNKGKPGVEYSFTFNAVDPDGDDIVNYTVNWGEGPYEILEGPFTSGSLVTANHIWTSQRTYTIMAKAKDKWGAESNWTYFDVEIEIPRNRASIYALFQLFFDRFPLLERLLTLIRVM